METTTKVLIYKKSFDVLFLCFVLFFFWCLFNQCKSAINVLYNLGLKWKIPELLSHDFLYKVATKYCITLHYWGQRVIIFLYKIWKTRYLLYFCTVHSYQSIIFYCNDYFVLVFNFNLNSKKAWYYVQKRVIQLIITLPTSFIVLSECKPIPY